MDANSWSHKIALICRHYAYTILLHSRIYTLFKVNSLGSSLKLFGIDLIPNAETQKMNFVLSVLVCGDVGCFLNFPHSPAIVAIVK